jgi:hypothetical protein
VILFKQLSDGFFFNRQLLSIDNFVRHHGFGRYCPLCPHCGHPLLYPPGSTSRRLFSDPFDRQIVRQIVPLPSPPPPFSPRTAELGAIQLAAESLKDVVGLLKGVNGLEAQQNLLKEVCDNVKVLVDCLDGIKQDFAKEVRDNVQVLVASLDEIKQLAERAATLLERGVIGPRELPYLKEVVACLKAGVDSLEDSIALVAELITSVKEELTLLRTPSGPGR